MELPADFLSLERGSVTVSDVLRLYGNSFESRIHPYIA